MGGMIFINYRRGDEPGFTQALFGRLEQAFPADRIFIDVDSIPPGQDFALMLESQVAQCDALLVVIGKGWLDARDERGNRRLDDPNDFVRFEIESAIKQDKRVIPVLVHDAQMPRADDLPEAVRPLAGRHAVRLTHERFGADTQALVKALQRTLEEAAILRGEEQEARRRRRAFMEPQPRQRAKDNSPASPPDTKRPGRVPRLAAAGRADVIGAIEQRSEPAAWWPSRRGLLTGCVLGVVFVGLVGVWFTNPYPPSASSFAVPLSPERERVLEPNDSFKECNKCPLMVVVPEGNFTMGSPITEQTREPNEGPQHVVIIAKRFAVGSFAVTFDEWDACVADGGCKYRPQDGGWGRGRRPVIDVNWDDAKAYVGWLSRRTGRTYRLLSEAEFEYAARAGSKTAYSWGDRVGNNNANCVGCGSGWDSRTAPVGSFAANAFGLYDMAGNVWEWLEDCYYDNYIGAPTDGSARTTSCIRRVVRGGSWAFIPQYLRSASRSGYPTGDRFTGLGFRVGRTLAY